MIHLYWFSSLCSTKYDFIKTFAIENNFKFKQIRKRFTAKEINKLQIYVAFEKSRTFMFQKRKHSKHTQKKYPK